MTITRIENTGPSFCKIICSAVGVGSIIVLSLFAAGKFNPHNNSPETTYRPSFSPTNSPTPLPSFSTLMPTHNLENLPTYIPTPSPSGSPILSPSRTPTSSTLIPTALLTQAPSVHSENVTLSPTSAPVLQPSIPPSSPANGNFLYQINDAPFYLQLTSSNAWGADISCSFKGQPSNCQTLLQPKETQTIEMGELATDSSGLGLDYNLYTSYKNEVLSGYSGHIHINYNKKENSLVPSLTNNANGLIYLNQYEDTVSIELNNIPTLQPVTPPPTTSIKPSLKPTVKPSPISPMPTVTPGQRDIAAWYIDWTYWFTNPPYPLPSGVNRINIFVGEFMYDANKKPTIGGFGTLTPDQIDALVKQAESQNILVRASIGGGGGSYDNTWDLLSEENIDDFAQGLVDYCQTHGLAGIDFDYEEYKSADQERLVGLLIKRFKELAPNLEATLCTNAGFGPNYPWQQVVQNILDAAVITPGKCPINVLEIMSYYNDFEQEKQWINGWKDWMLSRYNCPSTSIGVGIDTFDANAYNPQDMIDLAEEENLSEGHWAFDPAHPTKQETKLNRALTQSNSHNYLRGFAESETSPIVSFLLLGVLFLSFASAIKKAIRLDLEKQEDRAWAWN